MFFLRNRFLWNSSFSNALRQHFSMESKEPILKLYQQKFLCPLQSRWAGNDGLKHITNSVYIAWAAVLIHQYTLRHFDMKNTRLVTAESSASHRKPLCYPEMPVGGVCVTDVGNSMVMFNVMFYKLKSASKIIDPLLFNLTFSGKYSNEIDLSSLVSHYDDDPAATVRLATVFVNEEMQKPVKDLPATFLKEVQRIFIS